MGGEKKERETHSVRVVKTTMTENLRADLASPREGILRNRGLKDKVKRTRH